MLSIKIRNKRNKTPKKEVNNLFMKYGNKYIKKITNKKKKI
jgi:hypothetical protein